MDLRPEFKKLGLAPERQGDRGTCSVFVTKSALEYAYSRHLAKSVKLSVEYLNWAANQVTGQHSDGQFFRDLLDEHFSEDESRRQLETAIQWGRYAEIFDYDAATGKLTLTEA